MATHAVHKAWLKVTAIVIGSFGPVFALATMPSLTEPARLTLDMLTWPLDGFPSYTSGDIRFLSALTGGFLLGWGVMVWMLSTRVYDHAPEAVRKTVLTGALAWFVTDSLGSALSGHPINGLWNLLFLLIAIGPLWRPAHTEPQP